VRPASIPVLRERTSIWSLEEEAHVRLSVATVLIASDSSALGGTFKQRQALPLHSLEGRPLAMIDHHGASITCDLGDYNLLVEVAHAITDPYFVKVDFLWKLITHGLLMLAGSRAAVYAWTEAQTDIAGALAGRRSAQTSRPKPISANLGAAENCYSSHRSPTPFITVPAPAVTDITTP
jgi:hypothetical protein